jgi:hypothetical protein
MGRGIGLLLREITWLPLKEIPWPRYYLIVLLYFIRSLASPCVGLCPPREQPGRRSAQGLARRFSEDADQVRGILAKLK